MYVQFLVDLKVLSPKNLLRPWRGWGGEGVAVELSSPLEVLPGKVGFPSPDTSRGVVTTGEAEGGMEIESLTPFAHPQYYIVAPNCSEQISPCKEF